MVQWIIGSILHGGPIELYLVPIEHLMDGLQHIGYKSLGYNMNLFFF